MITHIDVGGGKRHSVVPDAAWLVAQRAVGKPGASHALRKALAKAAVGLEDEAGVLDLTGILPSDWSILRDVCRELTDRPTVVKSVMRDRAVLTLLGLVRLDRLAADALVPEVTPRCAA